MPDARAELAFALGRPFAEQVAFFRGKLGDLVPTAKWDDLWKSRHDRAFMVAGAAKADLLADLAAAVDKAISEGETLDAFRKRFGEIVRSHGWHGWTGEESKAGRAWRTRIIYQTNLSTSYAAGRLAQLREAGFRYWVYRHSGSEHPRLQHKAWNGLTLPADHPFWQTHYPPSGWGCRCRVVGANGPEGAKLLGGDPAYNTPPAGWDVRDAKGLLPGVDNGWDYQPGATVVDTVRALAGKTVAWPYELSKAYMSGVPQGARDALALAVRRQPETGEAVRRYAQAALAAREVDPYRTMGLLTQAEAETIAAMTGVEAIRREMYDWAVDASTVRKVRNDHGDDAAEAKQGQTGVTVDDYALLPKIILEADRIEYGGLSDVGRPVVRVIRRIDGMEYWAVFEVRGKRRMLALQSMWKRGRPPILRP